MTSGEKIEQLKDKKFTTKKIQELAKSEMNKYWGKDTERHNFWQRVFNNAT